MAEIEFDKMAIGGEVRVPVNRRNVAYHQSRTYAKAHPGFEVTSRVDGFDAVFKRVS